MSFNNTPPEITDYVLDFLHDNPKALRACAQVCSTWLPTSYHHLFSRIALKSPKSCSAFCHVLQDAPRIGHLVHDLSLVLPRRTRDIDSATESVDDPLPLSACASLKDLDHLSIIVWDFDTCSWSCLMTLHSLTHLTLRHCRFPSSQTFTTFVAAFPCLSTLDVGDVYWDTEVLDESKGSSCQQLGREPSLRTLVLGAVTSLQSIVDWLLHQGLHSQITSISTRCSSEADTLALNYLCAGIGGSLQSLGLDWMCPKSTSADPLPSNFTLNSGASIKSLNVRFPIYDARRVQWVPDLLSMVTSSCELENLSMEIRLLGNTDAIEWGVVRRILTSRDARFLKQFSLKVRSWPTARLPDEGLEQYIRHSLPELSDRAILRYLS